MEIIPLFPTPVFLTNINRDFTKDELQLFFEDILMRKEGNMSNHQSKDSYLFDIHTDTLGDIKKFCEYQLKNYLEEIEGVDTNLATLRITQSWLNKNKPNEWHPIHHHSNCYLSGVLYISCLPNDYINLTNRSNGNYDNMEFPKKKNTIWNSNGAVVDVKEGDLILFPSWIPHSVNRNETKNRERISLAFNTFPIGEIGNYDNVTHLKL